MKLMMPEGTQHAAPANGAAPQTPAGPTPADLAARSAEIKKRGAEIKADRAVNAAEKAQLEKDKAEVRAERAEAKRIKDLHALATQDPAKFQAAIYGESWQDTLAKLQTGDKSPLEMMQLRQKLADMEAREAERNKPVVPDPKAEELKAAKAQEQEMETQFQAYRADTVKRFAKASKAGETDGELADKFPSISAAGVGWVIADEIRRMHHAGEIDAETDIAALELKIATAKEADLDKLIESMLALPKWQAKVKPTPAVKKGEAPLPFQVRPKALSQQMQAGTAEPKKKLSREQRRDLLASLPQDQWDAKVGAARGLRVAADE